MTNTKAAKRAKALSLRLAKLMSDIRDTRDELPRGDLTRDRLNSAHLALLSADEYLGKASLGFASCDEEDAYYKERAIAAGERLPDDASIHDKIDRG